MDAATPPTTGTHRVELPAYAGPMDLLLYLVKRHEIDLHDIPMAELVDQYLHHLRAIEEVDVEKAGDFLVMAATLLEVKSKTLAAVHQAAREQRDAEAAAREATDGSAADLDAAAADAEDPRLELVKQLLAYRRFRDAAHDLEDRAETWSRRQPAGAAPPAKPEADETVELDLEDVNVLDLSAAFGRVMESIGHLGDHAVTYDDTPISLHADDIVDRLQRDGVAAESGAGFAAGGVGMTLVHLFEGRSRSEMVGLFLATLELVRQRRVRVEVPTGGGGAGDAARRDPSRIRLVIADPGDAADDDEAALPRPADVESGLMNPEEYEWPDVDTRRRAERRQRLRREALERGEQPPAAPLHDDLEDDDAEDAGLDDALSDGPSQADASTGR